MSALYHSHIVFNNKHPVFCPIELFGSNLSGRVGRLRFHRALTAGTRLDVTHFSCAKPLTHDITTAGVVFRI